MAELERDLPFAYRQSGDNRLALIAGRQGGVVSTQQARSAGLDDCAIRRRVEAGRLHPLFRGAFAVGHRDITRDAWFLAATLAIGRDCGLGFYSAVQHYGLWNGRMREVHLVVPRRLQHRDRIRIHAVQSAPQFEEVRGVRVVPPALAVLQFASVTRSVTEVKRVAREAQVQKLATHEQLLAVCADGARGSKSLRTALTGGPAATRNGGEDLCLELIRSCGLNPLANHPLLGFVADFFVPAHGLVIEFDGRVHDIPIVRGDDHRRQAVFEAAGIRIIRLDWVDITELREQARRRILAATAA